MKEVRQHGRFGWSMLVLCLFLLPLGVLLAQFWMQRWDSRCAEQAAQNELSASAPRPQAWGVLGSIRLEQGRIADALPLLRKASAIEASGAGDSRDTLALVQADLDGSAQGLPGASRREAEAMLVRAQDIAAGLPMGRRAATWFSAGLFWRDLGRSGEATEALTKAAALQPDDWVDQGGGHRTKSAGLAAYYQKMLAGALEH